MLTDQEPSGQSWTKWLLAANFLWILAVPLFFSKLLIDTSIIHRWWMVVSTTSLLLLCLLCLKQKESRLPKLFIGLIAAVSGSMLLSTFVNGPWLKLWPDLSLFCQFLIFFLIAFQLLESWGDDYWLRLSANGVCLIGSLVAAIGVAQAHGFNPIELPVVRLPGSTLADRPFAAEYVAAIFPWFGLAWYQNKGLLKKLLCLLSICLLLYYLLLLRGRAGYVAVFLGALFYLIFWLPKYLKRFKWREFALVLVIAIPVLFGILFLASREYPQFQRPSFTATLAKLLDTQNSRVTYWKTSVRMISQRPVWGYGPMSWSSQNAYFNPEKFYDEHVNYMHLNPHNDFIEHWCENGLPGLLSYLAFVLIPIGLLLSAARKDQRYLFIATSAFCILIASNFSFTKDRTAPMIIAMLNLAVAAQVYLKMRPQNIITVSSKKLNASLFLIALGLLFYTTIRMQSEQHYVKAISHKFKGQYTELNKEMGQINDQIYPLDPNEIPIQYYFGVGLFNEGKYKKALLATEEALELQPNLPTLQQNYAASLFKMGLLEEAAGYFEEMKQRFPNYFAPQLNLVAVNTELGNYKAAVGVLHSIERTFYNYTQEESVFHEYSKSYSFITHVRDNPIYLKMKSYYAKEYPNLFFSKGLFKYRKSPTVFLYKNGYKLKIETAGEFARQGFAFEDVIEIPEEVSFPDFRAAN